MKKMLSTLLIVTLILSVSACSSSNNLGYLDGPSIDSAPVDLNDLNAVTKVYVFPLIHTGDICSYSWETPADIMADHLIDVCAYNNFLHLPVIPDDSTIFSGAEYANSNAPAEDVETSIIRHFNVTDEYLRTAEQYNSDSNTYTIYNGWGGGWSYVAMSATQEGNKIVIEVGISEDEGVPQSIGLLTVEVQDNKNVKYHSYKLIR